MCEFQKKRCELRKGTDYHFDLSAQEIPDSMLQNDLSVQTLSYNYAFEVTKMCTN